MLRRTDYAKVAPTYDRRYEGNRYPGTERALLDFAGADVEARIVEVGCGTGHWLARLSGVCRERAGLDASAEMLAKARERVPDGDLRQGRAEHLPWADRSFDRVFCINAFHHFDDKPLFLSEARRVLRPGGAVMTVGLDPHHGGDRWFIYDYFEGSLETDLRRYPASASIRKWMREAGFDDAETVEAEHLQIRVPARAALQTGQVDKATTSQLSVLTDHEYRGGLERIEADIEAAERRGEEMVLSLDLRLYATIGYLGAGWRLGSSR